MKRYGLIGFPLGHSLSPRIHGELFKKEGIEAEYRLYEIPPDELPERISLLRELDGCNVTIPHKQAVIPFLDELHESAARYRAVNCIRNKGGRLIGYNTDCDGFLLALESAGLRTDGRVLLLGCGGAGRMMAIEAALHGAQLTIAVRKGSEAAPLAVISELRAMGIDNEIEIADISALDGSDCRWELLINSTPVGMFPKTDASPVSEAIVRRCSGVFDAVYNPERTLLLEYAQRCGVPYQGGMPMLVGQAQVAHKYWGLA